MIRRFQAILNSLGGKEWSEHEAKYRGLELLRLMLLLLDPEGYAYWQRHPSLPPGVSGLPPEPPPPSPPPVPQPYPINLEADHQREIVSNLKVKRRPTAWR